MSSSKEDDELLTILLTNLRNASKTFGETSRPYQEIHSVLEEHLKTMQAKGHKTNVSGSRTAGEVKEILSGTSRFGKLALRPKPGSEQ